MIRSARDPGLPLNVPRVQLGQVFDHDADDREVEIGHARFALWVLVEALVRKVLAPLGVAAVPPRLVRLS